MGATISAEILADFDPGVSFSRECENLRGEWWCPTIEIESASDMLAELRGSLSSPFFVGLKGKKPFWGHDHWPRHSERKPLGISDFLAAFWIPRSFLKFRFEGGQRNCFVTAVVMVCVFSMDVWETAHLQFHPNQLNFCRGVSPCQLSGTH